MRGRLTEASSETGDIVEQLGRPAAAFVWLLDVLPTPVKAGHADEIDGIEQISLFFDVLLGHGNVFMPKTTNLNAESFCWNFFILVNSPKHSRDSR